MSRVVLIGFMASGKSTVGELLADRLGWECIDFDDEIERRTGTPIREIFEREGGPAFRQMEAELTEALADRDDVVLAPGGGWITQPELLELLGPDTLVVWLRISPEEAVRRSERDAERRPLLAGPDPLAKAEAILHEREPLYGLADAVVEVDGQEPEDVAWEIEKIVRGG